MFEQGFGGWLMVVESLSVLLSNYKVGIQPIWELQLVDNNARKGISCMLYTANLT